LFQLQLDHVRQALQLQAIVPGLHAHDKAQLGKPAHMWILCVHANCQCTLYI
jgi:hypothetical protein